MPKGYRAYLPEQDLLLPPSLRHWLDEDHLVYFVSDVVDQLDLSAIHAVYEQEKRGQPPYDRRCPERRCDLRLSIINTLRCPCLDGKSFLDPVVVQGTHQLRDLPIAFEATEFAFRQQQRGASPAFAMVPLSPTLHSPAQFLGHRAC